MSSKFLSSDRGVSLSRVKSSGVRQSKIYMYKSLLGIKGLNNSLDSAWCKNIILQIFFATCTVLKIEKYLLDIP